MSKVSKKKASERKIRDYARFLRNDEDWDWAADVASAIQKGDNQGAQRLIDSIKQARLPRRMEMYLERNGTIVASTQSPKDLNRPMTELRHIKVSQDVYFDTLVLSR
jgi:hypothetical protein